MRSFLRFPALGLLVACGAVVASACGGSTDAPPPGGMTDSGSPTRDGAPPGADAASDAPASNDGSPVMPEDGGAMRNASCTPLTDQTGMAVNTPYGRLDGTLVYVLPVGGSSACNGDDSHVHLQIEVAGSVYDVAVDIGSSGANNGVGYEQQTIAVPGGAWSEGWHGTDDLSYKTLGLSSTSFMTMTPQQMGDEVVALLVNTSKISIFCTGYDPGFNGCHDVHYKNGTQDGAIFLDPTAAMSPVLYFRFTNQTF